MRQDEICRPGDARTDGLLLEDIPEVSSPAPLFTPKAGLPGSRWQIGCLLRSTS